ncbi:unnamed protein product [Rhizophagus irregularis]|nr:unnamed protein product [Rhizophagus irregularis]
MQRQKFGDHTIIKEQGAAYINYEKKKNILNESIYCTIHTLLIKHSIIIMFFPSFWIDFAHRMFDNVCCSRMVCSALSNVFSISTKISVDSSS